MYVPSISSVASSPIEALSQARRIAQSRSGCHKKERGIQRRMGEKGPPNTGWFRALSRCNNDANDTLMPGG
jgi:hypothetical protein